MFEAMTNYHKKFLMELIKSRGRLDSYRLFRRLKCSFSDFSRMHRELEDKNLIRSDEHDYLHITPEGRTAVMKIADPETNSRPWREIPKEFKRIHSGLDNLYVPNATKLDKKTFKI